MTSKKMRIVHCGTAAVGEHALRGVLAHPDFELVGLFATTPEKIGRDAGELVGLPRTGVIATNRIEDLVALKADCLSYFANVIGRETDAVAQFTAFLESGTNVVTASFFSLIDPTSSPETDVVNALERACRRGGTSVFNSGIEPGFATVHLPAALLSLCASVESVRIIEFFNYGYYPNAQVIRTQFGFGMPPDYVPDLFVPGRSGSYDKLWGPSITLLARQLGKRIDELRLVTQSWIAKSAFEMAATRVEAGTVGAVRFEVQGIIDGRPVIIVEHVNYGSKDAAPEWERPAGGDGTYRIEIRGKPDLVTELCFGGRASHSISGRIATVMHVINAIPAVCAAPPGLLAISDLPMYTTRAVAPG